MITSPGVGSGLDVNSIVTQIMAIEKRPLQVMQQSQTTLDAQLSAYGRLSSALSTFQTALDDLKSVDSFQVYSVASSNESAITASADSNAAIGTLNIQVNRLAQAHKESSLAKADKDVTGMGGSGDQMTITVGGNSVTLDVGGKTLNQIRDAINSANTGVTASVITENATSNRLVLTSKEMGSDNAMSLSFTGTLGTDLGMSTINNVGSLSELDSEIVLDNNFTITRGTNTISDAIDGVTLTLKAQTTSAATLTVSRDVDSVTASVQKFVDAYNAVRTTITSVKGRELKSDGTLRSIEAQIQNVFNTLPVGLTGSYNHLSQVGVSILKDGTMKLDSDALKTAISTDFKGVAEVFSQANQGYLVRLDSAISNLLETNGIIDSRQDGIKARQKTLSEQMDNMDYRLQLVEKRYRDQFNALDTMMGQMQTTSAFLTRQLG